MIGRFLLAMACALGFAGCATDEQHPPFASGTCTTPPCGAGIYRRPGGGGPLDAGADAADGRD